VDGGSNKSLYTLIAVVVFGIFLSLSYFLFQGSFKGILADVMDKTSEKADTLGYQSTIFTDPNFSTYGLGTRYTARSGVTASVDPANPYDSFDSLKLVYASGSTGARTGSNDLVIWLTPEETANITDGTLVEVTFYAKADRIVNLGTRLGNDLYSLVTADSKRGLTTDWLKYTVVVPCDHYTTTVTKDGAVLFWVDSASTVWLDNISVRIL
jgi:hypothetical protein